MAKLARSASTDIPSGPSQTAVTITPHNSTMLDPPVVWVDIAEGGTISFVDGFGATKTLTVSSGYSLKCVVQRINATGTSATGFIGYP